MVDHWGGIFGSGFYVFVAGLVPFVNVFVWNESQLGDPSFDVDAFRVIVGLLAPRIENPEVRLSVSTISHSPLPTSRILHGAVVN